MITTGCETVDMSKLLSVFPEMDISQRIDWQWVHFRQLCLTQGQGFVFIGGSLEDSSVKVAVKAQPKYVCTMRDCSLHEPWIYLVKAAFSHGRFVNYMHSNRLLLCW